MTIKEKGMNYKALLAAFIALSLGLGRAAYGQPVSYKEGLRLAAERIGGRVSAKDIVAVVEFRAATPRFGGRVIDDLIDGLMAAGVRVVDRQNLDAIRAEQQYHVSGYVDDAYAVSLGRELGAAAIILGSGENMADYCRLAFRLLSVETAEILARFSVDVRYDQAMRRLLDERADRSGIGATHFLIGGRLGAGFEINAADEDMVGSGYSPKEKSNVAFNGALYGAYRFNDVFAAQAELNVMLNNGMEISGHGDAVKIDYTTLDIPLLLRWNFMQSPVAAGLVLGPYISLPAGRLNVSAGNQGSALDMKGFALGAAFGFALAYKLGPGSLTVDARYINDFGSLYVSEDFGEGMQDANICIRRSINITVGYEFSL